MPTILEKIVATKREEIAAAKARVSEEARALLPRCDPPVRRSLAWVLGQFGGEANLVAIHEAAATTEDNDDLREMAMALA